MEEIFGTICLAGAIQALLLVFVLIIKKKNRRANLFLSLFLVFGILDLFELYLGTKGITASTGSYQLSIIPYSLIFGPSIFLYIALLTAEIYNFTKKLLLLYLPFIAALLVNLCLYFTYNLSEMPAYVKYINVIINGGGVIFELTLYIISLIILQRYIKRLKEYFSDIDSLKLSLFRIVIVIMIITVFIIYIPFSQESHVRHDHSILDIIPVIGGLSLIFGLTIAALLQPETFNKVRLMENAVAHEETETLPQYKKLRLSASEEELYVKKLIDYMSKEKPYLNEELTLQDIADEISISSHHLSMILNIHLKQNFYTFINYYRIEDVKEKLADSLYKSQTILSIAYSAGFNSKSTFNTMFKKFTEKTPKEYRSEILI